jgi:hypothetical protein
MLYCDGCAKANGHEITSQKQKGECELCRRRLGTMNVMPDNVVDSHINNVKKEDFSAAGIKVKQVPGFVPGTNLDAIEPGAPHRFLSETKVLFHQSNRLIIADMESGKRVEINF